MVISFIIFKCTNTSYNIHIFAFYTPISDTMAYPSFKPQRTGGKKKPEDGGVTTAGHTVSGVLVQLGKFLFLGKFLSDY